MSAQKSRLPIVIALAVVVALVGITLYRYYGSSAKAPATETAIAEATPTGVASSSGNASTPARNPGINMDGQRKIEALAERRRAMRAEQTKRQNALRDKAAAEFAGERKDPAWARGKERELDAIAELPAITDVGADPKQLDIECRARSCKIDGLFDNMSHSEDWVLSYMSSVGNALPTAVVTQLPNPDGSIRVDIYGKAR